MQGGLLVGNSHANGGIKIKTPEGQIEAEGGEVIINKRVMALDEKFVCEGTPREITSKVNEMEGGVSWSETGSCRIMKKAEDGSEIEEEITLSDDGFGVLYVSGGKNYIVTADTKDQAEIIEQSIKDFKDGFITKDELENTLQSYMNDDHELAGEVQTIGGKPYVYNDFYAGYIPVMDAEAHNIDYSSELGDGGSIYGDTLIKAANGVNLEDTNVRGQLSLMNIEYERIRGDYKIGNIDENEYYQYKKEIVNKYLPFIKKGKELGVPVNMGLLHNTNLKLSNGGATTETASQGSILRSSNPEKRPSPSVSATIYPAGFQMEGNDGNTWEIALDSRGIHRWKKVKGEDGLDIAEENAFRHDPMEIKFKKEPIVQWDGKAFAEAQLKAIKERRQSAVLYCDDTNGVPNEDKLRTLSEDEDYRIDVDAMNALYSYEFYKNGNLVCIPQIEVFNYEYTQEGGSSYRNMYDEYRGAFYTKSEPKPVSFMPTDYSVYTEGCNLSDEDTALLEEHARIIFNKFLKDVDITESSAFIITKDELNAALKEGTELAANGKKVTKASLLKTVSDKDEYWFTPEGRISSEKKGTANEFIQHEWAKMFGANNMKLVGGNDKEYVYELEGNPMMIAAATSYLQEEKGVEIETYGRKKRVHIPKKVIDSTSAHLRYPLITPFRNGGFVGKGELVWRKLSSSDKIDFLYKNFTPEITPRSQEILVGKSYNFLPKNVKITLNSKYANVEEFANGGRVYDEKTIVDFVKALEDSKIVAVGAHLNPGAIDTIKAIVSMSKKEYAGTSSEKVKMIYTEFNDWIQTYKMSNGGVEGLPENYYRHAIEMENKIYTGGSYHAIVSNQSPNFFNRDTRTRGYVDKFGEFYDVEVGNDNYYADGSEVAADGKQIEQADILTNSMLSILDLFSYISMRGNKIVIQGSTYTYSSHGKYNLRVTGGKGATYNIVPYFPEKHGKFVDANFYSLIRQKVNEHFAITKEGELIDVAEDGTEIKS